jgi:outer membrane protein assembly factor BamB
MRIPRFVRIAILVLIGLALVAWLVPPQISRWQTRKALAQQAEAIAAHRETQRATSAAVPAATPTVTPSTTTAVPAAPASPAVPAIAWTNGWSGFRGARRDGHYSAGPILTDWTALRPLWRQPIGGGHASFVAANGHAFTIEQRGGQEVAVAYDVLTGRERWTNAWDAVFISNSGGGPGPRATPAFHDGTLFVLGATGELRALDASSGNLRWRTNVFDDAGAAKRDFGIAVSPLIVGNTVVTVPGGGNGRTIVAYDRASGRVAWSALDDAPSYSSPVRVTIAGVEQIVAVLDTRVVGLSTDGGKLLWESPWSTDGGNHAAQPVIFGDNRIFLSLSTGVRGLALEITREGDRLSARELWRTNRMKNSISSSVHHEGFIYGLDLGILACIDAANGELKWKGGRYGEGQMLLASDHLVIATDDGQIVLVRATPEAHQEVARTTAVEGATRNHPALVDGFLLVRNAKQMAAFDLRPR